MRPLEKSSFAPSHYSRLFGGPFPGHDETDLRELSARMKDIPQNRRGRPRRGDLAPSAFVYLGQFLDHDLTRDETPLAQASAAPERTKNFHTPRLDLESVYGGGPERSPHLYDQSEPDSAKFLLGETTAASHNEIAATRDDFFRRDGRPMLADDRNDQHLILAQLHVAFLQFHNKLVDSLKRGAFADESSPNESIFQTARRLMVWHYQWIVRHEFLNYFILGDVLIDIERRGPRLFRTNGESPALPIEFSQAAFRFGHSTVQLQYDINCWRGLVKLRDLVRRVRPNDCSPPLSADQVIDWDRFTRTWGGNANFAENIDTLVAEDLFDLPAAAMPVRTKTRSPPLPEMTLTRGSRIGLPSGQEACRLAGEKSIPAAQMGFDSDENNFLRAHGLSERTPLWYYLLREAEELGVRRFRGGECLGPLGSRIVAEVLLAVLDSDPDYYRNVSPDWKPLRVVFGKTNQPRQLDTLRKFLAFAKDRPGA
jgi:Animal haem peroxidase